MLTMTRLPSDSFLPTGGMFDHNERAMSLRSPRYNPNVNAPVLNPHTASAVSPLSLPHSTNPASSYFDDSNIAAALASPPHQSQPMVAPAPSDLLSQRYRSLSPRLSPPTGQEKRSPSRSPTRYQPLSQVVSNTSGPAGSAGTSVSSATSPPDPTANQSASIQLQRVIAQNRRLLENWEAERAHLEANRARAEEIYREERAIMDDERMIWADTESRLLQDASAYRARAEMAEHERDQLAAERDALKEEIISLRDRAKKPTSPGCTGSDGASDDLSVVAFRKSSGEVVSTMNRPRMSRGITMPESDPLKHPLDPRMQSRSPDSGTPSEKPDPVPVIAVNEVDPTLDGLYLKRSAVEKSTFSLGTSKSTSSAGSAKNSPTDSDLNSPSGISLPSTSNTKEVLKAPEDERLRMNAGHTPNHSISLSAMPTADSTVAPNTASSSGTATPTEGPTAAPPAADQNQEATDPNANAEGDVLPTQETSTEDCTMEALLDPSEDDRPLRGPLCLMNFPAKDEPFLNEVSTRLLGDITPSVLKSGPCSPTEPCAVSPSEASAAPLEDASDRPSADEEGIKPLVFKNTSNFGAAFGELKGTR